MCVKTQAPGVNFVFAINVFCHHFRTVTILLLLGFRGLVTRGIVKKNKGEERKKHRQKKQRPKERRKERQKNKRLYENIRIKETGLYKYEPFAN